MRSDKVNKQAQPGRGSPVHNRYCEKSCEIKEGSQEMV